MKINVDDNVRMIAALGKVKEGKYFDALCLFARVDSYESMLNQIGCLCHLRDTGYAVELYRRLLARFYFTHNCYRDVAKLGEETLELLSPFDAALNGDDFDESKLSAEETLLGNFGEMDGFDDEEFWEEFEEVENAFCDVTSPEYFFRTIKRLDDEISKGNLKKSQTIINELLEFDSSDESVLEGQMFLCLAEHDFEKGAQFAERYAALANTESCRGVAVAVGLLSGSSRHTETLNKMLARLVEFAEEIPDSDLMEYVEIAESYFEKNELTGRLAEILFARHTHVGCEALRVCARVFCNMGWKKQARDAILTLQNACPWDSYADVCRTYIDSDVNVQLDKSFSNVNLVRHMDVPTQLAVVAEYQLIRRMEKDASGEGGENCIFYSEDYKLLHCITNVCKTHVYRGNSEKFVNEATVLSTVLFAFEPQNKEEFFDFAKQQLCSFLPEASVQKEILLRLIKLGFCDKILVSNTKNYYPLELNKLKIFDDFFLNAFCLCAALRKVDVRRLQRSYLKIKEVVDIDKLQENGIGYDTVHQLAYCMLAVSYKDFAQSSVADFFSEGENQLYLDYLAHNDNGATKKLS